MRPELLDGIARAYGTPTWVLSWDVLRARYRRLARAMDGIAIHYAVKANGHLAVLAALGAEGAGADIVSGGELLRALAAGIPPGRIVFSGVGKTQAELAQALDAGVGQINVESEEELHELSAIARARGVAAQVALRVNPDVDAGTLDKISTGRAGDKFGIPLAQAGELYAAAAGLPGISAVGLAVHIGSQINGTAAFAAAYAKLADLVRTLRAGGLSVAAIDCGGGLAIPYADEPSVLPEAWAACIRRAFAGLDLRLAIEPGRWLVGPAGVLLASVIRVRRQGLARPIVILDAAMNDLLRPAMYGAHHTIVPVSPVMDGHETELADVAGPVCESSDFLARGRLLPRLSPGAVVAILDCGAYGSVMSSTYNARPWAAQVMTGGQGGPWSAALISPRGTPEALWAEESLPA